MFPLRDTIRSRTAPVMTWAVITANALVFVYENSLSARGFDRLLMTYGLVPARLSLAHPASLTTLVSSAFLHGGWFHLISNMWILYIFGDNVEDRMGSGRFLFFYLLSAVVAGSVQVAFQPSSRLPTVGASGAIAGVLGAYFVLFPNARVTSLILLVFIPWLVDIPAFVYLGIWFLSQVSSGLLAVGAAGDFGGIAWWAHIGGFLFGVLAVWAFVRRPPPDYAVARQPTWPLT